MVLKEFLSYITIVQFTVACVSGLQRRVVGSRGSGHPFFEPTSYCHDCRDHVVLLSHRPSSPNLRTPMIIIIILTQAKCGFNAGGT